MISLGYYSYNSQMCIRTKRTQQCKQENLEGFENLKISDWKKAAHTFGMHTRSVGALT